MPILTALGDFIGAGQTAQANPYYGAQYLTPDDHPSIKQPMWVDANGQPINDPTFTSLHPDAQRALTSTPFKDPGFWGGLGNIGKAEKLANLTASEYAGQAAQQRQAESLAYQNNTANMIGRSSTALQMDPIHKAMFAATGGFDPSAEATSLQNQSDLANNVYGLQGQAKAGVAGTIAAQNPQSADSDISQTAALRAQLAKEQEIENQHLQGWNFAAQNYNAQNVVPEQERAAYVNARYPGYGGPQYRMGDIGDPGSATIGALFNPTSTPINNATGALMSGLGGVQTNPTWTGSNSSDARQAGASPLAGNYVNLPPPANPPASIMQQSGGPSVPPFVSPIGSAAPAVSDGTGANELSDEDYLHPYTNAAFDHLDAINKLNKAQQKVYDTELEKAKQAHIARSKAEILAAHPELNPTPYTGSVIGTLAHNILRSPLDPVQQHYLDTGYSVAGPAIANGIDRSIAYLPTIGHAISSYTSNWLNSGDAQ